MSLNSTLALVLTPILCIKMTPGPADMLQTHLISYIPFIPFATCFTFPSMRQLKANIDKSRLLIYKADKSDFRKTIVPP